MKSYFVETYGCQMNVADSELLMGLLEQLGLVAADCIEHADVVFVNTCTVRETAAERALGRAGQLGRLKANRPDMLLCMCGCLPQQPGMVERIRGRASDVDLIFGPDQLVDVQRLLELAASGNETVVETGCGTGAGWADARPRRRAAPPRAWVPIMKGCSNYCSYCVVPYVRGTERSRDPEQIVAEVEQLVTEGFMEVTLLGQNVNAFGLEQGHERAFERLLVSLDQIEGLERIRFTTSHPRDFTREMVATINGLERVCEHFHLPLQSGSDRVLELMNRGYNRAHYLELATYIRELMPGASITTDIMVAFPGETEADLELTLALCREVEFDSAFTFIYSPRAGTAAAALGQPLPRSEAGARLDALMQTLRPIHLRRNQRLVGANCEILVEGISPRDRSVIKGRTRSNRTVLLSHPDNTPRLERVRITAAGTWTLQGRVMKGSVGLE